MQISKKIQSLGCILEKFDRENQPFLTFKNKCLAKLTKIAIMTAYLLLNNGFGPLI